ncbi:hypothetical protein P154DRAFT_584659 [Amniculicola lignicola CBS 123094]|uniref:RING-type domain-containing protein n=1 Tax=Amniculicola lignicola CBS 123094 TaxID=1392246 RepID=A0A6A5X551_9PLEO|nr:hypothetical protein P154DRAFT_584659 [Amniculicola lignicola CBS 123094]
MLRALSNRSPRRNNIDSNTNQASLACQGVYIPLLSKVLGIFLAPESLSTAPRWDYDEEDGGWNFSGNICPYFIPECIHIFGSILDQVRGENWDDGCNQQIRHETARWRIFTAENLEETVEIMKKHMHCIDWGHVYSREYPDWMETEVWIIRCALHPAAGLNAEQKTCLKTLLKTQPVFTENFQQEVGVGEGGAFYELQDALYRLFRAHVEAGSSNWPDKEAIVCLLQEFIRIAEAAENSFLYSLHPIFVPNDDREIEEGDVYEAMYLATQDLFKIMIEDRTSPVPLRVRAALSTINFRSVWNTFWDSVRVHRMANLRFWLDDIVINLLRFVGEHDDRLCSMMSKFFTETAGGWEGRPELLGPGRRLRNVENFCTGPVIKAAIDQYWTISLEEDYLPSLPPFIPLPSRFLEMGHDGDDEEYPEVEPYDMTELSLREDVVTVAVGPRVNIENHVVHLQLWLAEDPCSICLESLQEAGAGQVVHPRSCNHLYHIDCIDDLVNSAGPTSNLCTMCRRVICSERRTIQAEDSE